MDQTGLDGSQSEDSDKDGIIGVSARQLYGSDQHKIHCVQYQKTVFQQTLINSRSKTKRRRKFSITNKLGLLIDELSNDKSEADDQVFWRFSKNNPSLVTRKVREMRKVDGLPDNLKTHMLRHTFGSHLAMAGVDMLTIAELMGHTNTNVTEM